MTIETEVEEAKQLANWIARQVDGLDLHASVRAHLAAGCLSIALEHHSSIVALIEQRRFPSAVALMRPLFESYVRGSWLAFAATDAQVDAFKRGTKPPLIGELIRSLEQHPDFNVGVLSHIKLHSWAAMCDFTHTGTQQVMRNITENAVQSDYLDEEIISMVRISNSWALLAATSLSGIARDEELGRRLLERANVPLSV